MDHWAIARLVVLNLEPQEFVNRIQRRFVIRCDNEPSAARRLFHTPMKLILELRHRRGSRNCHAVN